LAPGGWAESRKDKRSDWKAQETAEREIKGNSVKPAEVEPAQKFGKTEKPCKLFDAADLRRSRMYKKIMMVLDESTEA
jgi:hypothetical protein